MIQHVTPAPAAPTPSLDEIANLAAIDEVAALPALLELVDRAQPLADAVRAVGAVLRRAPDVHRLVRESEATYQDLLVKIDRENRQLEAVRTSAAEAIARDAERERAALKAFECDRQRLDDELARAAAAHTDARARLDDEATAAERAHQQFLERLAGDHAQTETDAAERKDALAGEIVAATARRDIILAEIHALRARFATA